MIISGAGKTGVILLKEGGLYKKFKSFLGNKGPKKWFGYV
jgi:hypothetical protein